MLAAAHVLIVSVLGGQLLYDRVRLPRVWVQTVPYDPDLPIRGRYLSLRLLVSFDAGAGEKDVNWRSVHLAVQDGQLTAISDAHGRRNVVRERGSTGRWVLAEPVAYFIAEHVPDPSRLKRGDELWVECTIPKNGPPRPIRVGLKPAGGTVEPLDLD